MTTKTRSETVWQFWKQAEASLNVLEAELQRLAPVITQYPPLEVPRATRAEIRRNVARFSEKFNLLVHAQRHAARKGDC